MPTSSTRRGYSSEAMESRHETGESPEFVEKFDQPINTFGPAQVVPGINDPESPVYEDHEAMLEEKRAITSKHEEDTAKATDKAAKRGRAEKHEVTE